MEVWQEDDFKTGVARIYNIQPQYGHELFCIVVNVVLDSQNEKGWEVTIGALDVEQNIVYVMREFNMNGPSKYESITRKEFNPTFFVQRALDITAQKRVIYRRDFDLYLPAYGQMVSALSERLQRFNIGLTAQNLADTIQNFESRLKIQFWTLAIPCILWTVIVCVGMYYETRIPFSSFAAAVASKLLTVAVLSAPIWLTSWFLGFNRYHVNFDSNRIRNLSEIDREKLLATLKCTALVIGQCSVRSFIFDCPQEAQTLLNK